MIKEENNTAYREEVNSAFNVLRLEWIRGTGLPLGTPGSPYFQTEKGSFFSLSAVTLVHSLGRDSSPDGILWAKDFLNQMAR